MNQTESFFETADKYLPYHEEPRVIIGLCGFAQSGKDTIGSKLVNIYGFKRLSFATALRKSLYELNPIVEQTYIQTRQSFWKWLNGENSRVESKTLRIQDLVDTIGWDRAKTEYPEVRKLLQRLGTEAGRNIHGQDCWTNIIQKQIRAEPKQSFVLTDVRFPNEKQLIEKLGGYVIQVDRYDRDGNLISAPVNDHISDKGLDGVGYKIVNPDGDIALLEYNIEKMVNFFVENSTVIKNPIDIITF